MSKRLLKVLFQKQDCTFHLVDVYQTALFYWSTPTKNSVALLTSTALFMTYCMVKNITLFTCLCMHFCIIITLFLVFVCLPIYCVHTQFLNKISSFLSFFTFSPALLVSIPSPKYLSEMINPFFSKYAFVTSSRQSKIAMHAFKKVYFSLKHNKIFVRS